jgi:hypothetical protein
MTHASRGVFVVLMAAATGCGGPAVLTQLVEARQRTADVHLQFSKASDASSRAVMAEADDVAAEAAAEARASLEAARQHANELRRLLASLGYADEQRILETFAARFDEYRALDAEILPLATENSNVKAQRLSFGPAREAAAAFRRSLDAAARTARGSHCQIEPVVARAGGAVLEILVLFAPHIAEARDDAMTKMEEQIAGFQSMARRALGELAALLPADAAPHLKDAAAALDRFDSVTRDLIALSRRNSDVRSLALTLGRKRQVAASCEDQLRLLEAALAKHQFTATR